MLFRSFKACVDHICSSIISRLAFAINGSNSLVEVVNCDFPGSCCEVPVITDGADAGAAADENPCLNEENSASYMGLSRVPIITK